MDDLRARAKDRLTKLEAQPHDGLDAFHRDALAFFSRVPEPPVYRRRDDPTRALATLLLTEAETLLARAWRLGEPVKPFVPALELHGQTLGLLSEGKVEAAEAPWLRALELERAATAHLRLWHRTDEQRPRVFDEATRRSRFDPHPEAQVQAKLVCPACRQVGAYSLSPRVATHALQCLKCSADFTAYVTELKSLDVTPVSKTRRRYHFSVEEPSGLSARVEFEDVNHGELSASRRDLLAFLYDGHTQLRGVLNLDTSRVLWVSAPGACFIATVAFGEGAQELTALRGFRDRVLLRSAPGRVFTHAYYRVGPGLARGVGRHEVVRSATRAALRAVIPVLERWR